MTASDAFKRFRFSFFEDGNSARDGLDLEAVRALRGEERSRAEEMLLRLLPDMRAAIGLGELRASGAEPPLTGLFLEERRKPRNAWSPYRLAYLAKALWQIRPDARWRDALIDVLRHAADDLERMQGALALAVVRDPAVVSVLVAALDDPARLVRHHAARALLAAHGVADGSDTLEPVSEHMRYRVMAGDAARRESGKRDILAAIAGKAIVQE
jgi:hypothetical protein